ncbi:hypothetical protein C8Q77DRAFT_313707 [Trametes polyzona]|nr:hypothetical protein C8Q77DRAFT_313707 [Trametes polyzona]
MRNWLRISSVPFLFWFTSRSFPRCSRRFIIYRYSYHLSSFLSLAAFLPPFPTTPSRYPPSYLYTACCRACIASPRSPGPRFWTRSSHLLARPPPHAYHAPDPALDPHDPALCPSRPRPRRPRPPAPAAVCPTLKPLPVHPTVLSPAPRVSASPSPSIIPRFLSRPLLCLSGYWFPGIGPAAIYPTFVNSRVSHARIHPIYITHWYPHIRPSVCLFELRMPSSVLRPSAPVRVDSVVVTLLCSVCTFGLQVIITSPSSYNFLILFFSFLCMSDSMCASLCHIKSRAVNSGTSSILPDAVVFGDGVCSFLYSTMPGPCNIGLSLVDVGPFRLSPCGAHFIWFWA